MEILHVASFDGNIGDVANHNGFRHSMGKYISSNINFTNLEIREFYQSWGLRKFNDEFVNYANQFDLLVFGGGNFFELCWDYSATGTTIDLSNEMLDKIRVPILFNGMGIDDKKGNVSEYNIQKFKQFLNYLIYTKNAFISVRNDGSKEIAEKYYDEYLTNHIYKIPDGGFFAHPRAYTHIEIPEGRKIISINLAGDAPNIRFSTDGSDGRITELEFVEEFATYVNQILELDLEIHLVFVPHIMKDYSIIMNVMNYIKDIYVRTRISVAPCVNGTITEGDYLIDIYRKSIISIGMRYHANICSIAVNTPSIGIVNFSKHKELFRDIGMDDRCVPSDLPKFSERLYIKSLEFMNHLDDKKKENNKLMIRLNKDNQCYFNLVNKWLEKQDRIN